MKKLVKTLLVFALVFTTSACNQENTKVMSMADEVKAYLEAVDEDYAFSITETLAIDERFHSNEQGFRTAGSKAEHDCAKYLADEMESLGLEVEMVEIDVDSWEFKDASLKILGTDIDITPASYPQTGIDTTATIVDCGTGFEADYVGVDVAGKIALIGVDQWNEAWIDLYITEAYHQGAIAVVSYDVGGYGTINDEVYNIQDVCCEDLIPTAIISKAQADQIIEAINNGNDQCALMLDSVVGDDTGTSYNVVGKLKGKSSDQQIIVSGHYDMYFKAYQDDSSAIGLVLGMAKAMKEANYQPENDILFVAHGAEEWGVLGTEFDWTSGAWGMIYEAHPEWAEKTLAVVNFELCALYDGFDESYISSVPEFGSLVNEFVTDTNLLTESVDGIYKNGVSSEFIPSNTMEDGISYRHAGVPYFVNVPGTQEGLEGWTQQRYHTQADDASTYSPAVMHTNLNTFGSLVIYLDQMPALNLDLSSTVTQLKEGLDKDIALEAGIDYDAYIESLEQLQEKVDTLNAKIKDINTRYEQAMSENKDTTAIREEGVALNKQLLSYFKYIQDHFVGIILSSEVTTKHAQYQNNVGLYKQIIAALEEGIVSNEENGALDLAWMLNGGAEYGYYLFSEKTNEVTHRRLLQEFNPNMRWATDRGFKFATTYPALYGIFEKSMEENPDFSEEIAIYEEATSQQLSLLKETVDKEIKDIQELTKLIAK